MMNVIRCADYDYFEMVCMRQSRVIIRLTDGQILEGVAKNLLQKSNKEFLQLQVGDESQLIDLIHIAQLSVKNAAVDEHNFSVTFLPLSA